MFYLAVLPQFIPHGGNTLGTALILGLTLAVIGFLYLVVFAMVAYTTMKWLKKPKVNAIIERVSSSILAVLGIGRHRLGRHQLICSTPRPLRLQPPASAMRRPTGLALRS